MKLYKSAKGKDMLKISKSEWENIGKQRGWLTKEASGCPCCGDGPCDCEKDCKGCDCK